MGVSRWLYVPPLRTRSALTNVEFDSSFILKTVLKDRPATLLGAVLVLCLFAAAYMIRMVESLECSYYPSLGCAPLSFADALWLVVVTTLTIGYGDLVPHTTGEGVPKGWTPGSAA